MESEGCEEKVRTWLLRVVSPRGNGVGSGTASLVSLDRLLDESVLARQLCLEQM